MTFYTLLYGQQNPCFTVEYVHLSVHCRAEYSQQQNKNYIWFPNQTKELKYFI